MESAMEDRIREHAYFLWLDNNKMGDSTYFWLVAERAVMADVAKPAAVVADAPAVPQPAPASKSRQPARRVNALVLLDAEAEGAKPALGIAAE